MKKKILLVVGALLACAVITATIIIAVDMYYQNMSPEEKFLKTKDSIWYDLNGTSHEDYVTILKSKCRELIEAEGISVKDDLLKVIFTHEMGYFILTEDGEYKIYDFDIGNHEIYVLAQQIQQQRPIKFCAILPYEVEEEWEFYLDGNTIKLK